MDHEIKINYKIREKYTIGLDREYEPITTIVIHGTAGGATLRYIINNIKRKYRYKKAIGLFHYYIKRNGQIIEIINTDYWTYHSHSNKFDKKTIGIELSNYNFKNKGDYTEKQYDSLHWLCGKLKDRYNSINQICSHNYLYHKFVTKKEKKPGCPGEAFDWEIFKYYMKIIEFDFDYEDERLYNIERV